VYLLYSHLCHFSRPLLHVSSVSPFSRKVPLVLRATHSQLSRISPAQRLLSHFRFLLTLRSEEGKYHALIVFRLSTSNDTASTAGTNGAASENKPEWYNQIYVMESACPHLGAEMSHADIEEYEDSVVAVCPWHRYTSILISDITASKFN
jgi:hypothetical protein